MKLLIVFVCLAFCPLTDYAQYFEIRDRHTNDGLENVEISSAFNDKTIFSDDNGSFNVSSIGNSYQILFLENLMEIQHIGKLSVSLFDISGHCLLTRHFENDQSGKHMISIPQLIFGLYYLNIKNDDINKTVGIIIPGSGQITFQSEIRNTLFSFKKEGYHDLMMSYENLVKVKHNGESIYMVRKSEPLHYLTYLPSMLHFDLLKGKPFNQTNTNVSAVKILYDIDDKKIYYFNANIYLTHYEFAFSTLLYPLTKQQFSTLEYSYNDNRHYIPATLNYYASLDIFVLEFSSFCEVNCTDATYILEQLKENALFKNNNLYLLNANEYLQHCDLQVVDPTLLYGSQQYQPLSLEENYGYLRIVDVDSIASTYLGPQDILLTNDIPSDINVIAGLITSIFQTPLSHVNVLSHNRKTPNMALKKAFDNKDLSALKDQLVYLKVSLDTFELRPAQYAEADSFWRSRRPQKNIVLTYDTIFQGLVDLSKKGHDDIYLMGGKASNFAELKKILLTDSTYIPLPEYDMAIPFYYYHQHIKSNRIDQYIATMLSDSAFYKDVNYKRQYLLDLQEKIKKSPIDPALLALVQQHILQHDASSNYRFRSSTNAEDIEGFNGAGLYDSYTGSLNDKDKEIDKAIKKVWASLWNMRAFEERTYFGIDHQSVAMAILVHRSFPDEYANGVVITHNPYNQFNSAILINVQVGENSVVRPEETYLPDQILYFDYKISQDAYEYISHTTFPGFENQNIMTPIELKELQTYSLAIKNHFCQVNPPCKTMDIEFKIDIVDGRHKMYIKQARYY